MVADVASGEEKRVMTEGWVEVELESGLLKKCIMLDSSQCAPKA
jgi:hypothetical protein